MRLLIDWLPFISEGYATSEVDGAHIHCIISLSVLSKYNPIRIQEFLEKSSISVQAVQALETMKKVKDIKGYVRRLNLSRLPGMRADLVRLDVNWQEWNVVS